jgi:glycosyltransferase involved in cell wall biosynthesis
MDGVRRLLSGRAAALVANSHHTAREFARDLPGVEVQVIHNGIDLRPLGAPPAARQEARRRLALGAEQPVIAVVGQLVDWKGQADAIHVLAQLRHAHPDICLLIVGGPNPTPGTRIDNGAYAESLDVLARELGVERHVRLLGHRDDVPSLLPAVDVLLVPSWEEPFGRVVLEGMAMRLPVVATDAGGPAEIITTGQDGVLLTPRRIDVWVRTVGELLDAPEARRRIGDRARDRVARDFTLEQHATRLVEVYQAVIERDDRRLSGASAGGSSSPA